MSGLLDRLKALRGDAATVPEPDTPASSAPNRDLLEPATQLNGRLIRCEEGVHIARDVRLHAEARHGNEGLGGVGLHPLLMRQAGAATGGGGEGRVLYIDTETTGLAGGTGTFAFLIGVGLHCADGFEVRQLFLPGPEHERSQLNAFASLAAQASAVVTYNGASFDLPLLRNRFAMNGMPDPLAGVPHLDLLTVARRLWKEILPDCSLSTVERRVLGARRSLNDVPGFEVPARYFAYLRSKDASGLRGVLEHNETDIVALTALRCRIEQLLDDSRAARAQEAHALGQWLERLGEAEHALTRYLRAASSRKEAAWHASLLLKRLGRLEEARDLWLALGRQGKAAAWVELAKEQEHRWRDYRAALESVEAAAKCPDCEPADLERRRQRLVSRLERVASGA